MTNPPRPALPVEPCQPQSYYRNVTCSRGTLHCPMLHDQPVEPAPVAGPLERCSECGEPWPVGHRRCPCGCCVSTWRPSPAGAPAAQPQDPLTTRRWSANHLREAQEPPRPAAEPPDLIERLLRYHPNEAPHIAAGVIATLRAERDAANAAVRVAQGLNTWGARDRKAAERALTEARAQVQEHERRAFRDGFTAGVNTVNRFGEAMETPDEAYAEWRDEATK